MRKLYSLVFWAAMILCVCLTGCSENRTDHAAADIPNQMQPFKPIVPGTPNEVPLPSGSSNVTGAPSADASEFNTGTEASEPIPPSTDGEQPATETLPPEQAKVDIDLTKFNSNMLYAEVYNMGLSPEDYINKTIKITGQLGYYQEFDKEGLPVSGKKIPVCVINDTMACCWLAIEFAPADEASFFNNCPDIGSVITITGMCNIFTDKSGFQIIQLNNAKVEPGD